MFNDYELANGGAFDEVFAVQDDEHVVRPHYAALLERLHSLTTEELATREHLRDQLFRSQGITFTVYGEDAGVERTFPMDLIPRIIPADEWATVEAGIAQRIEALNRFLEDLYVGERAAINDGIIPWWVVVSADGFVREAAGIQVPQQARCLVAGIDVVRDEHGDYRVLEDNVRNPSGISYVLENRAAMTRVLPRVFASHRVEPVDHYGRLLLDALRQVAPAGAGDDPVVVVLTPGVFNSAYFEHVFLARQMGVQLVEGRDLVVDDHAVFMRTTTGLQRVDVIYRRIDDDFLDPVVFDPSSMLGVSGIVGALRAGTVTVANAIGNGVADDKAVYAYVPDLIRYYLGSEPILPNIDTYLLWEPDQRDHVLANIDRMVVKPVAASGGYGLVMGPTATDEELAEARDAIVADPRGFVAQDVVTLSCHPTLVGEDRLAPRHVDLRPFAVTGDTTRAIPGGLTRVALREGSLVVNSSQGGGSKDTWVLSNGDGWEGGQ